MAPQNMLTSYFRAGSPSASTETTTADDSIASARSSQTGASSVSQTSEPATKTRKATEDDESTDTMLQRAVRSRRGAPVSYNENVLSGSSTRNASTRRRERSSSSSSPGYDTLELKLIAEGSVEDDGKRRSSRLTMVDQGKALLTAVGSAASVLGKRVMDAIDGSDAKRLRFSEDSKKATETMAPQFREKKWLTAGLYNGQEPAFDKKQSNSMTVEEARLRGKKTRGKGHALSLPMYAGERILNRGRPFVLPFDVFAPPTWGTGKVEGWRKLNSNVLIDDASGLWRSRYLKEISYCLCNAETGCDEDCQNRHMLYECDERTCLLSPEVCGNRQFADLKERTKNRKNGKPNRYNVGVDIIAFPQKGFGLRANRSFEPGQIVMEYCGEILTQDDAEKRMREEYKDAKNMILDAFRGSAARFVNHSCEPNSRMEKWYVGGVPRMALFAGEKGIKPGEELTYDYNFDPFSSKNVETCYCGTRSCRGILGRRPTETNRDKVNNVPAEQSKKRKFTEVVTEKRGNKTKKQKVTVVTKFKERAQRTTIKITKVVKTTEGFVKKSVSRSTASSQGGRDGGRRSMRR